MRGRKFVTSIRGEPVEGRQGRCSVWVCNLNIIICREHMLQFDKHGIHILSNNFGYVAQPGMIACF